MFMTAYVWSNAKLARLPDVGLVLLLLRLLGLVKNVRLYDKGTHLRGKDAAGMMRSGRRLVQDGTEYVSSQVRNALQMQAAAEDVKYHEAIEVLHQRDLITRTEGEMFIHVHKDPCREFLK